MRPRLFLGSLIFVALFRNLSLGQQAEMPTPEFVPSTLLATHGWKNKPMVLVSLGSLLEQLGLKKTKRRFSFAQLTASRVAMRETVAA